jgi:cytidylate kinase
MHETDSNRAAYIKQLYGHDWCDVDEYDLIVNTGNVGYEAVATMILDGVRSPALAPA